MVPAQDILAFVSTNAPDVSLDSNLVILLRNELGLSTEPVSFDTRLQHEAPPSYAT